MRHNGPPLTSAAAVLLVIVFASAACTQGDPSGGATVPVTPSGSLSDSSSNVWVVGVDITPGTYRSSGGGPFCTWERLRGLVGSSGEGIGGEIAWSGEIQTVTIMTDDAGFQAAPECGTWSPAPTTGPKATEFGGGAWIVGVDIAPGRYRSSGRGDCFWRRLGGFGGTPSESQRGSFGGIETVDIVATDVGFASWDGCGSWSPAPTHGPRATEFGSGAWIVGVDIAPGKYRSSGGDGVGYCSWSRLSAFDGDFYSAIELGGGRAGQSVTIDATDVGFGAHTSCGMWSLDSAS